MKIFTLTQPVFVTEFTNHKLYKKELLDIISKQPFVQNKDYGNNDKNITDWFVDKSVPRKYADLLCNDLALTLKEMLTGLGVIKFDISEIWFQQYYKNNTHAWHDHISANYANVYYLELPEGTPVTTLINPLDKSIIVPEVKEGDILSFPGSIQHCSPPNKSNKRKTVIAFNIEFKDIYTPLLQ